MMRQLRRLAQRIQRQDWVQRLVGKMFVGYYRLVVLTSRVTIDPPDYRGYFGGLRPCVGALWHGEALLMPFPLRPEGLVKAMTSRSRDGGIISTVLEAVGVVPNRASGGRTTRHSGRRGGAVGIIQARDALRQGAVVCMTADIPKGTAYEVGPGIIALARLAGCPIIPIAAVSSTAIRLGTWDRMAIALPFGRVHAQMGRPISIADDADEAAIEAARLELQAEMDRVHAAAYAVVGRPGKARTAARPAS